MLIVAMYNCYGNNALYTLIAMVTVVPGADIQPGEPGDVQCGVSMDTGGGKQG